MMIEIKGILGMIGIAIIILFGISQIVDKLLKDKKQPKKWYEQSERKK